VALAWDDAPVDTVEWGSGPTGTSSNGSAPGGATGLPMLGPAERPAVGSRLSLRGRWVTPVLAGLGVAGLVAAEFLPWVSLHITQAPNTAIDPGFIGAVSPGSDGTAVGVDAISTVTALAYHLGVFAVLALMGAVQFGRLAQRRRLVGFAVGVIAAQGLCVISVIHSVGQLSSLDQPAVKTHTVIEPGAYLAIAALLLILASVVLSVAPERVQVRLADAVREPDDGQFTDEPIGLTVTQVKPLDEAHWTRPDPHGR
jgi:hypothetical protein